MVTIIEAAAAVEIRPAVPGSRRDRPQEIPGAVHAPAAAVVETVIGHVQAPILSEGQAERVAKAPRHQLRCSPSQWEAQDGAAAWHLAAHDLPRHRLGAEGGKRAGLSPVVGIGGKGVGGGEVHAGERDIPAGEVADSA